MPMFFPHKVSRAYAGISANVAVARTGSAWAPTVNAAVWYNTSDVTSRGRACEENIEVCRFVARR